jgi:hypothetical protein
MDPIDEDDLRTNFAALGPDALAELRRVLEGAPRSTGTPSWSRSWRVRRTRTSPR